MKKNRRKIIITAGILAAVIVLGVALACSGSKAEETVRKAGQEKTQKKTISETAKEEETRSGPQEKEGCTSVPENTVHGEQQKQGNTVISVNEEPGGTESTAVYDYTVHQEMESTSVSGTAGHQEARPGNEPKPTAHVHSYVLTDTRAVEHPAVTEQIWVEDSPAWDETVRAGYHVCVVTCHECGAQFADTSQANALEAWGEHADAAHDGDGGYDMAASYDVPAETVHHEASGHYETRTVTPAWTEYIDTYRCSCGDTYTQAR